MIRGINVKCTDQEKIDFQKSINLFNSITGKKMNMSIIIRDFMDKFNQTANRKLKEHLKQATPTVLKKSKK